MAVAVAVMSDHEEHDQEGHSDHGHDDHGTSEGLKRVTSPMQEFGSREVGIGALILAVGLLVAFAIPLALG
jgi:hypothetical protein